MKTAIEALQSLQWILSAGTNIVEAIQLNNELERLRDTLPKARVLICRSEWGMFKDKELAKLVSRLKDTTYDAEDLLRELDDQVLRKRIEDADRSRAGQLLSSSLNLAKTLVRRSKTRIRETQDRLEKVVAEIEGMLNLMGLMSVEPSQIMPETSSVISAPEVVGRDGERDALAEMLGVMIGREVPRDQVIKLLGVPLTGNRGGTGRIAGSNGKRAAASNGVASTSRAKQPKGNGGRAGLAETKCTNNVSVISIVGIGGVGKTTLAQFIYNDPRVKHHFGVMIWVCVSDFFDKRRITKEIIESIPGEEYNSSSSLNALQIELMKRLKTCPKFLLVLDDIWPNANADWEAFYAPLKYGPKGSMILVTTRSPVVATRVTTSNCKPVQLEGLPTDILWDFFKKCAFGTNDPESYSQLQDIARSISTRLCGSPLAAKTLGRLLNMSLTERHWRAIQKSELWELRHEENEILPALQLSYLYLPEEVKRCFVFCSMFPKDYSFEREEIVDIWVAQGFVAPGGSIRPEDVGITYLDELRNRFLFQTDPMFPNKTRYVMHDLIHDMAVSFSMDECLVMQDLRNQNKSRMQNTVRHMSIEVDGESLSRMGDIQHLNKLHSLRFGIRFDVEITWFNQLSNILFLSLKGCKLVKLPDSICELNSLRYLDISHSNVQELPEKLWCLYSLQVFDASRSRLKKIHQDVTKLINLRQLVLPAEASRALSRVSGLGNLSCLRRLSNFIVAKKNGRGIGELKFMNQLSGKLSIRYLYTVRSEEEALEARLVEKQYLKELVLHFRDFGPILPCSTENGVLEGLRPHSRIECLKVHGFCGDRFPSWFKPEDLPTLITLELSECWHISSRIPFFADGTQVGLRGDDGTQHAAGSISRSNGIAPFAFSRLTDLRVYRCVWLTNLEQFLTPEKLPSIKSIVLDTCSSLTSIPFHSFVGFVCLRDLKIYYCEELECPQEMVLPPSLQRLCIGYCGELERSFPACLENLTSLTLLQLDGCHNIKCISLNSIGSNMLKCLVIHDCRELSSIGGLQSLVSIQHVDLHYCPKLTEVQLPFEKKELRTKEGKELLNFLSPCKGNQTPRGCSQSAHCDSGKLRVLQMTGWISSCKWQSRPGL
ncbi:hypothetical protein SETIT_1G098800v2 [Setaria italica]|uniref:Uncharacterized protein n=1 Tax=Setaria italica TaxID=4555 RepID=A0A368PJQ0_SETIT|nr:disease resistance protein RGA2 isoform X1 [Setaria italica]XP_004952009.1 disease resistance protein RGA2 isoform X1 [Setaria italica]XP_004952010.1 disease resistance protein RGA2 isoform X1 [Setaria italica]XP_022681863.1 disease resistance protein RGA2 isoform X1 [Setaria italica]XP_022681866.1 disease resistance protein RGA2 isoform X1 [Setaria italica]RCV05638.1 hypothetical protein SETIT_1G098800v2 [Setaria italica]